MHAQSLMSLQAKSFKTTCRGFLRREPWRRWRCPCLLRRRDGDQMSRLMFDHMRKKCDAVCEYMREHQPSGRPADVAALRSEES